MSDEPTKRDRHAKAREEAYRAGFADGIEVGKLEAETLRDLAARVRHDSEKRIAEGLARLAGVEKPRRTRGPNKPKDKPPEPEPVA